MFVIVIFALEPNFWVILLLVTLAVCSQCSCR